MIAFSHPGSFAGEATIAVWDIADTKLDIQTINSRAARPTVNQLWYPIGTQPPGSHRKFRLNH
jgi:hypothetical protein